MFNEENTSEKMIIDTLVENGWKYIAPEDLNRSAGDIFIESMVRSALVRLNPEIAEDESRADEIINKLYRLFNSTNAENLVTQNEIFKQMVFEQNSYPFGEDGRQVSVEFFGTEINGKFSENEFVVTNQWSYPKVKDGKRLDIVLLVNGFPFVVGEVKTPVRAAVTWLDGAQDINAYEKSIPQMFVTNVFNFATEGKIFRYGSVCMPAAKWGSWHTSENKNEGTLADVKRNVADMITPKKVIDIFQFFTLFATDSRYQKYKVVARYQQYEGANMILERVRSGSPKQGLIWHFQGSGKSYLMEFAAVKMRMLPDFKNPTILIVDDRLDLETQITEQFHSSDVGNLETAGSCKQLEEILKNDIRKIIITTIFRFQEAEGELSSRENIIVMVDECHRTQEGDLGLKMRMALPNAFFFGLTGTPINRVEKNTFKTFGALEDRNGYMSKYSFSDSVRDGATLPLHFEPVPIDMHVNKETLDKEFDALTDSLTNAEKAELSKRVNMEAIMYDEKRIAKVCAHIAKHFTEKISPNGYKAQVVVYDRPCCVKYKTELDKILNPESSTIVMDTNNDKADEYKKYSRSKDEESKILERFKNADDPLKILIVTSKLLTGFDAPVLQVMYLDKPMKDHTLLQAICRTNRTYDSGKTFGWIVDYIGIFDNVAKSLKFDDASMRNVITNIEAVKNQIPVLMQKCLARFLGVDRTLQDWEGLMAAQECIPTNKEKDEFAGEYLSLNRAWNAVSPDTILNNYRKDYIWLSKVYESVKPSNGSGSLIWAALGEKTMEIVHSNLEVGEIHEDMEIFSLGSDIVDEIIAKHKDIKSAAKHVEIDLAARLRKHNDNPKFTKLGEKLEKLREQHEQGLINSIELLKKLLDLSKEAAQAEKENVQPEEIDKGKAMLTELFNSVKNSNTPVIVERIVNEIDEVVRIVRFDNWKNTVKGQREIKRSLREIIWVKYKIKDSAVLDKAYSYVEQYY